MALPTEITVYRDSEIIYLPHWLLSDGSTVIKNSAGGMFPKPIVEPISIGIYHIHRWRATYTDATYKSELNSCNSGTWRGWTAGQAWCSRIITEDETVGGTAGTKLHYIIRCNEYGWNSHIAQMGYFEKSGTDKIVFEESIGLLDGAGAALGLAAAAVDADLQIKRRISFATIDA